MKFPKFFLLFILVAACNSNRPDTCEELERKIERCVARMGPAPPVHFARPAASADPERLNTMLNRCEVALKSLPKECQ